jgi:hypothetical protein
VITVGGTTFVSESEQHDVRPVRYVTFPVYPGMSLSDCLTLHEIEEVISLPGVIGGEIVPLTNTKEGAA